MATASTKAVGSEDGVVWLTATCGSRREPLINVVIGNKPKVLTWLPKEAHRLGPKGKGPGIGALQSPIVDKASPVKRRNLTHHSNQVLTRNVVSP